MAEVLDLSVAIDNGRQRTTTDAPSVMGGPLATADDAVHDSS
ncbi:hypothetical protein [Streptomyces sp. CS131]|nr:hypothetical protein [Streptomyces sp. CS131]